MGKVYLQLESKSGRIYQYSKTEQEGFEKHDNGTFRKYWMTGLYGTLQNVSIRDSKIGEQIQLTVKNNGDYLILQFPLYTQQGNIDNRYAESLIRFLRNLTKGTGYRFYPYAMEQEDSKYLKYGMSVITSPNPEAEEKGDKVESYLTYAKVPNLETDIPNLVWKEIAGKNKPSAVSLEAKDEFLYKELVLATDGHLTYTGSAGSNSVAPKTDNSNSAESKSEAKEVSSSTATDTPPPDEYDDLPF